MIEIIPSILVKTKEELLQKIMAAEGQCERVHLDVADGIFVPNMTIGGFEEVGEIETSLKIGAHLMVSKPENHVLRWLETSTDKIIFHVEATKKAHEIIMAAKEVEKMVGLALNPSTPLEAIKGIVDDVDFVHFMTVEPGFYGGKFIEAVIKKISDCHYFYPDKPIEADGGITPENALQLVKAGATMLVVGSYIWQSSNPGRAIEEMQKAASS